MKTLKLNLKRKWFDMIACGEKKEEYREAKYFWICRLLDKNLEVSELNAVIPGTANTYLDVWKRDFDQVEFQNGYHKNAPTVTVEFKGLDYGKAKPEWSDGWQGEFFIIKLGNIISTENM